MKKSIMIHSLFRAGSTYIFDKFRRNDDFWCYYEPLHHDIANLRQDALEIWKFDERATSNMNHPSLDKPHFYEYKVVFDEKSQLVPYFNNKMSYDEFTNVHSIEATRKYIENLIVKAPQDAMPVLQFNRTGMRTKWFKEEFGEAMHLFLLRNPRDQFESYFGRGPLEKNWFLAINLFIFLKNRNSFQAIALDEKLFQLDLTSDDVIKNLTICLNKLSDTTRELHYEIFMHMWLLSLIEANSYTDLIVNMDKMNSSDEYKNGVISILKDYDIRNSLNFDDFKIKHYNKFSMSESEHMGVEKKVLKLYKVKLSSNLKQLINESIGSSLSEKNISRFSRFSRFFELLMKHIFRR